MEFQSMNRLTNIDLRVPVTTIAHTTALRFAAEQANPVKGKQVYLNTLAVIAVRKCLSWVGVESILESSESWHPLQRAIFDVADLFIPDLDQPRIECRFVLPNQTHITIPPESIENRLGCVAIQFYQHMNNVKMLGFKKFKQDEPITEKNIAIDSFDRFETIFDYLHIPTRPENRVKNEDINLLDFKLNNVWRMPEEFGLKKEAFADNYTLQEAKSRKIDLKENNESNERIDDILTILSRPQKDNKKRIEVLIDVVPNPGKKKLCKNLKFSLEDNFGFYPGYQQVQIGGKDYFRKKITGLESGDNFKVILETDVDTLIERFSL
jgi:hypothetical protein